MPLKRKSLVAALSGSAERSAADLSKRKASALDLRERCATWSDVDNLMPQFVKLPSSRSLRRWLAKTGVRLLGNDRTMLAYLVSVVSRFDGLWLSAEDLASRIGCSVRTTYNVVKRLEALDLVRVVPQYDDVDPYMGRQTSRGDGSSGKIYTRQRRPNAITLGTVGRILFAPVALGREALRKGLASVVDKMCVADPSHTRQLLPSNNSRTFLKPFLVASAQAIMSPDREIHELERRARGRTRALLHLVE